jgi:hypothetical protein
MREAKSLFYQIRVLPTTFLLMLVCASATGIIKTFFKSAIIAEAIPIFFLFISLVFLSFKLKFKFKKLPFGIRILFLVVYLFIIISLIHIINANQFIRFFGIYSYILMVFAFFYGYQLIRMDISLFIPTIALICLLVVVNCIVSIFYMVTSGSLSMIFWERASAMLRTTLGFSGFLGPLFFVSFVFIEEDFKNLISKNFFYLVIIAGAFFSGSRMLLLLMFSVFIFVWPIFRYKIHKKIGIYFLKIFIIFIVFLLWHNIIFKFRQVSTILNSSAISNRNDVWGGAIKRIFSNYNFIIGKGFGVSGSGMSHFGGTSLGVESFFLKIFTEMGGALGLLFCFFLFLLLTKIILFCVKKIRFNNRDNIYFFALAISLFLGCVQNIFQMSLETPSTSIFFWTLFGVLVAKYEIFKKNTVIDYTIK